MKVADIREILSGLEEHRITTDEALRLLRHYPFEDIGIAKLDHHRSLRRRAGEIVYGASKTVDQMEKIVSAGIAAGENVCVSRLTPADAAVLCARIPALVYDPEARMGLARIGKIEPLEGRIVIVTAGTSDIPVAREAALALEFFGASPVCHFDCGVAGIHRLTARAEELIEADVVIAVAGMEGALPSVVAGMTAAPVIAVPTSVGTGANFGGVSALLSMLNSCAGTVAVVNIDGGIPAASVAASILDVRNRLTKP